MYFTKYNFPSDVAYITEMFKKIEEMKNLSDKKKVIYKKKKI